LIVVDHNSNSITLLLGVSVEQQDANITHQSDFLLLVQFKLVEIASPFNLSCCNSSRLRAIC
jgi:hypothetical protein